jgi:SOS-response transcriptional repressor LexA
VAADTAVVDTIKTGGDYVLRVRDGSLASEGILAGDLVVVQPADHAEEGETVVALLPDDSVVVRRAYVDPGGVRLESADPQVAPVIVPSVRVQGTVVAVLRVFGAGRQGGAPPGGADRSARRPSPSAA